MLYDELVEMIDSSVHTLFWLLRIALGNKAECKIHSEIDWRKIVDLSFSQGVVALVVDGLQKAYELNPKMSLEIDKPELEDLRYELFGGAMTVEADYSRHKEVIAELMAFYRDMAVKPILIKGYGLSLDYPIPEHRSSGDIDVYLYHLGEYADQMVTRRLGIGVKQNEDKHSVFELAGGAGFLPLLKALNGIVVRSLGVGQECVPDDFGPERIMERVMEELFAPAVCRRSESYLAKACRFFGAKWKFDLVFRDNYYLTFFRRGWSSFRGSHLKNSRNVWAN